jgi:hypothetical protein
MINNLLGLKSSQDRDEVFGLLPTFADIFRYMKSEATNIKQKKLCLVPKKVQVVIDPKVL